MKYYQAGYYSFRTEGWRIAAPSDGMSQDAKKIFGGMASGFVEMFGQVPNLPTKNRGLLINDRFAYLICVNYGAKGHDQRGSAYVHTFCFGQKDHLSIASKPEIIYGIDESSLVYEFEDGVRSYPVIEDIPYEHMDLRSLLNKYGINGEQFRKLVLGVIGALDPVYGKPVCIKKNAEGTDYSRLYRDIMFIISSGMPYHLRIRLSSFSYEHSGSKVFFSGKVVGENYVDLDTMEFNTDANIANIKNYEFTKLYNNLASILGSDNFVNFLNAIMEAWGNHTCNMINNSFIEPDFKMVEASFLAITKKLKALEGTIPNFVLTSKIEPTRAMELLKDFLAFDYSSGVESQEYLAELLGLINDETKDDVPRSIRRKLDAIYTDATSENFKKQVDIVEGRSLLKEDKEKVFERLFELYKENPNRHNNIYIYLFNHNDMLIFEYNCRFLIPDELKGKCISEIAEIIAGKIATVDEAKPKAEFKKVKLCKVGEKYITKLAKKAMGSEASSRVHAEKPEGGKNGILNELFLAWDKFGFRNSELEDLYKKDWNDLCDYYWEVFDLSIFDDSSYGSYQDLHVEDIAKNGNAGRNNAEAVVFFHDILGTREVVSDTVDKIERWILNNSPKMPSAVTARMQKALVERLFPGRHRGFSNDRAGRNEMYVSSYSHNGWDDQKRSGGYPSASTTSLSKDEFTVLLLLFYSPSTNSYNIREWAETLNRVSGGNAFANSFVTRICESSFVQREKEKLLSDVDAAVSAGMSDRRLEDGIKKYQRVLKGKKLKSDSAADSQNADVAFLESIFRGVTALIPLLALTYIAVFFLCAEDAPSLFAGIGGPIITGVTYLAVLVIAVILKLGDGFDKMLEYMGIDSNVKIGVYTVIVLLVILLPVILLLIGGLTKIETIFFGWPIVILTAIVMLASFVGMLLVGDEEA